MDYSCKLELTHNGLDPKKSTYVGARLNIETDNNSEHTGSGGGRRSFQRFILLYDNSGKVKKRWRSLEIMLLNRILSGIPGNAQLVVDTLSPDNPPFDPTISRRVTPKMLRFKGISSIVSRLEKISEVYGSDSLATMVLIITSGRFGDLSKFIWKSRQEKLGWSSNLTTVVFGMTYREKYIKLLADGIKASYFMIKGENDIYRYLASVGIPDRSSERFGVQKFIFLVNRGMNRKSVNLANEAMKKVSRALPENSLISVIAASNRAKTYFEGRASSSIELNPVKSSFTSGRLKTPMKDLLSKADSMTTIFLADNGKSSGLKSVVNMLKKEKIVLRENVNLVVLGINRKKNERVLPLLSNLLSGTLYNVRNSSDIINFLSVNEFANTRGFRIKFPEEFKIANEGGLFLPLIGDKTVTIRESMFDDSGNIEILAMMEAPAGEHVFSRRIAVTYLENTDEANTRELKIELPRTAKPKFNPDIVADVGYEKLVEKCENDTPIMRPLQFLPSDSAATLIKDEMSKSGLFDVNNKVYHAIMDNLITNNAIYMKIMMNDLNSVVNSVLTSGYFDSSVLIFSGADYYHAVSTNFENKNVYAFALSNDLLKNVKVNDYKGINRAANIVATEILNWIGDSRRGSSMLVLLYDFNEITRGIVDTEFDTVLSKMFIKAFTSALDPWKVKVIFLTSHNGKLADSIEEYMPTVNLASSKSAGATNVIDLIQRILDKGNIQYVLGKNFITVNEVTFSSRDIAGSDKEDVYIIGDNIVRRIVYTLQLSFPIMEGVRQFLYYAFSQNDPITWSRQIAIQSQSDFSYNKDTISINGLKFTINPEYAVGSKGDSTTVVIDKNWNCIKYEKAGITVERAKKMISEHIRNGTVYVHSQEELAK